MAKLVTYAELKEHNNKNSLYILLHEKVYDVTKFIDEVYTPVTYPPFPPDLMTIQAPWRRRSNPCGGLAVAARDATEAFEDVGHSDEARALLKDMLVGDFEKTDELKTKGPYSSSGSSHAVNTAVQQGSKLNAVAFVSPQNHPILIRTFVQGQDELKYHYIAHTSLDVVDERITAAVASKSTDCYLNLLYTMEDVAVYGYITPLKVKIIIALALTDSVVRDADVLTIFRALHTAYRQAVANPFLKLNAPIDSHIDHATLLQAGSSKWRALRKRIDDIGKAVGTVGSAT
ncbi:hypothetical protein V8D89_005823 [Ganoderma adspersum]